jgi:hypothetical protein
MAANPTDAKRKLYIRKPCRVYDLWPENGTFTQPGFVISYSNSSSREVSFAVRTWLNRPTFSEPASPLSTIDSVGSHIRLGREVGFWVGDVVVLDKHREIGRIDVIPHHQGEIDIGLLVEDHEGRENLISFSKDLIDVAIAFLSTALKDHIFPIAEIQIDEFNGERELTYNPPIRVDRQDRIEISIEQILDALGKYRALVGSLSLEDLRTLAVASRRFNRALVEDDIIDRFCHYWECCDFLAPVGKTINGVKLSGSKDQAIAKLLEAYTKPHPAIRRKLKELYTIRNDLVHNAIEDPDLVAKEVFVIRDLALHLFRSRIGIPFESTPVLAQLIQRKPRQGPDP